MKQKSVINNGSLYLFGNLFNKAIAFITVPVFTRILTAEEYGIVNTYTSWVALMAVIVGLSLGNSIRNAFVDMNKELGKYISSIFTLAGINFSVICIIYACISRFIELPKILVWLCLVESFSNFIINALIMKYVMEEEAIKRTMLLVLPNLIGAILSVILIQLLPGDKYYGRIIATCFISSIFGIGIMVFYIARYRTLVNKKFWTYALPISLPLIFHGVSCNVLGTSDRSVITYYCGAIETGIYSLIYNLSMVSNVLTSSAESVWIPRLTRALAHDDYEEANKDIYIYIYTVLFAFCGLLTIAPELVILLGGERYLSGLNLVFPIVASSFMMFIYGIYVNIEFFYKKTGMIAIATFVAASTNLLLNFIFVPKFGAVAAAYTTLVSYTISFILHSINAHRINDKVTPYKMLVPPLIVLLISGVITILTAKNIVIRWSIMIILGIVYIVICWFFKIKKILRSGKAAG